jgi:hypothetical protein
MIFMYFCSEATRLAHTTRILCTNICLFNSMFFLEEASDTEWGGWSLQCCDTVWDSSSDCCVIVLRSISCSWYIWQKCNNVPFESGAWCFYRQECYQQTFTRNSRTFIAPNTKPISYLSVHSSKTCENGKKTFIIKWLGYCTEMITFHCKKTINKGSRM